MIQAVYVAQADRMMTLAQVEERGIRVTFADGASGAVPFTVIPEIGAAERVARVELPNPYMLVLTSADGQVVELPWDYVRPYCVVTYQRKVEGIGARGRGILGARIRHARKQAGLSQEGLARAAGIARVTLARIESGDQSPRFETLAAIARGLAQPLERLLVAPPTDVQ